MNRLLTLVACAIFLSSCSNTYNVMFDNVEGITRETEVQANGMKVGEVEGLYLLPNGNILVKISMEKNVAVTQGSKFNTTVNTFTGSPINFKPGKSSRMLSESDTIAGTREYAKEDSESGNQVIEKVTDFLEAISKQDSILKRMENLDAKVDSLYRIISKKNSPN